MKPVGEAEKRKASSELYKSIDQLTDKGKKFNRARGYGIYTLYNTNSAIINVRVLLCAKSLYSSSIQEFYMN